MQVRPTLFYTLLRLASRRIYVLPSPKVHSIKEGPAQDFHAKQMTQVPFFQKTDKKFATDILFCNFANTFSNNPTHEHE